MLFTGNNILLLLLVLNLVKIHIIGRYLIILQYNFLGWIVLLHTGNLSLLREVRFYITVRIILWHGVLLLRNWIISRLILVFILLLSWHAIVIILKDNLRIVPMLRVIPLLRVVWLLRIVCLPSMDASLRLNRSLLYYNGLTNLWCLFG